MYIFSFLGTLSIVSYCFDTDVTFGTVLKGTFLYLFGLDIFELKLLAFSKLSNGKQFSK